MLADQQISSQRLDAAHPTTICPLPQDVCMPEVNGIELLSQVKADANLRAVPVVSEWRPSTAAHVLRPADASRWEQLHGCSGGLWWAARSFMHWSCLLTPVLGACPSAPCSDVQRGSGGDGGGVRAVWCRGVPGQAGEAGGRLQGVAGLGQWAGRHVPQVRARRAAGCAVSDPRCLAPHFLQVTKKEVQHIWQHVWRKRCAGATVPQLPPEAAAAMAAVAAAAATQQTHSDQQQEQQDLLRPLLLAQDVQQPAEPSSQQAQQAGSGSSVEQLILSGPAASLQERQHVLAAAVDMVQASHLQKQPLLCLRPSRLQLSQQGLAVQQEGAGSSSSSSSSEVDALYSSPEEAAGQPGCPSDMFSLGLLFLGELLLLLLLLLVLCWLALVCSSGRGAGLLLGNGLQSREGSAAIPEPCSPPRSFLPTPPLQTCSSPAAPRSSGWSSCAPPAAACCRRC